MPQAWRNAHYHHYALDCLRRASGTNDPRVKAVLIDMAQAWIKVSNGARKIGPIENGAVKPRQDISTSSSKAGRGSAALACCSGRDHMEAGWRARRRKVP